MVREFVSPSGGVFAVSWEGRFIPEMKQILGTYFEKYSQAVQAATTTYAGRRPLSIHLPSLVIETGGHMGWYYGRAYLSQSLPQGASLKDFH
jgi:hypothetical protein